MGIIKQFFNNTRKPTSWMRKAMVSSMNQGHAAVSDCGLSHLQTSDITILSMIADFGCGGGRNTAELLKCFSSAAVKALDYSIADCNKTNHFNRYAVSTGRCQVIQADVSRVPFASETFEIITAFETVYFWPGPLQSFQEVWRVLKPRERFLIVNEFDGIDQARRKWTDMIEGMRVFTQEKMKRFLQDTGFSKITEYVNRKRHWLCILAKK